MTDGVPSRDQRNAETFHVLLIGMGACVFFALVGAVFDRFLLLFHPFGVVQVTFWGIEGVGGELLGLFFRSAIIALAVFAIVWFGFVRRTGRDLMDGFFLALLGASVVASALFWLVTAGLTHAPWLTDADLQGDRMAVAERSDVAQLTRGFEEEQARIYGHGLFDAAALTADPSLTGLKLKLSRAQALVGERESLVAAHRRAVRVRVYATRKPALIAGYERRMADAAPAIARYWALNEGVLANMDGVVTTLDQTRGRWRIVDGRVTFARRSEQIAFAHRMETLTTISLELNDVRPAVYDPYAKWTPLQNPTPQDGS